MIGDQSLKMLRARRIVKLAAEQRTSAADWLRLDERGTFQAMAAGYLEKTASKALELGLSAEQVDREIADRLCLMALLGAAEDAKVPKAPQEDVRPYKPCPGDDPGRWMIGGDFFTKTPLRSP